VPHGWLARLVWLDQHSFNHRKPPVGFSRPIAARHTGIDKAERFVRLADSENSVLGRERQHTQGIALFDLAFVALATALCHSSSLAPAAKSPASLSYKLNTCSAQKDGTVIF
jgi:hypothetical protein